MVAGGGGGGGSYSGGVQSGAGVPGGITSFGTSLLSCSGGGAGSNPQIITTPSLGGTCTLSAPAVGLASVGGDGAMSYVTVAVSYATGGSGGASAFGGGGGNPYAGPGRSGQAWGSGGGGAGGPAGTTVPGIGGAAGGSIEATIGSVQASYPYQVGAGGGGSAGVGLGYSGGTGADGVILIQEFYQ